MRRLTLVVLCSFLLSLVGCGGGGAKTEAPKQLTDPPPAGAVESGSMSTGAPAPQTK